MHVLIRLWRTWFGDCIVCFCNLWILLFTIVWITSQTIHLIMTLHFFPRDLAWFSTVSTITFFFSSLLFCSLNLGLPKLTPWVLHWNQCKIASYVWAWCSETITCISISHNRVQILTHMCLKIESVIICVHLYEAIGMVESKYGGINYWTYCVKY